MDGLKGCCVGSGEERKEGFYRMDVMDLGEMVEFFLNHAKLGLIVFV